MSDSHPRGGSILSYSPEENGDAAKAAVTVISEYSEQRLRSAADAVSSKQWLQLSAVTVNHGCSQQQLQLAAALVCGSSICRVDWQQLQLAGTLVRSFCTIAGDFGCLNWWQLSWASNLSWEQSWFRQVSLHNFRCLVATAKTTSKFIASIVIMTCVTIMHTRHTCQATVVLRQRLFIY